MSKQDKSKREFKLTTLALKNKNTIFLLTLVIILFGIISYRSLPKELFPEVTFPTLMIQTPYFGNPPVDIENLVTRPLEKELESVKGLKELTSTSAQDASMIFVEFNSDVDINDAKIEVKDAVDRAESELPDDDFRMDPQVIEFDFSEFPIITLNLSGSGMSSEDLRGHAEYFQEKIETIDEIKQVNITGLDDEEVYIEIDPFKLEQYEIGFWDIQNAIDMENVSMSAGAVEMGDYNRSLRIVGEFESVDEIGDVIIKRDGDKVVYLKDVAEVYMDYKESTTYARLDSNQVVSLRVVKKSGENLLAAIDQLNVILEEAGDAGLTAGLSITKTEDQSDMIRKQLNNLENSMIMGVVFVFAVLFFFLGSRNAFFVGIAIPLSMFLSFIVISMIGYKINMIVLFSLILALGMLVDNAIVVVENIYRFVDRGYKPFDAAKNAVGEIAIPIISSTATTLAAFLPLAFWEGIVGKFMINLPITLIIVLTSSLFVALVIIPVFSATLISVNGKIKERKINKRKHYLVAGGMLVIAVIAFIGGVNWLGSLLVIFALLGIIYAAFLHKTESWFQDIFLSKLEGWYLKLLNHALKRYNPLFYMGAAIFLLIFTIGFFFGSNPKVVFFPENQPNNIYIEAVFPLGIDVDANNEFMLNNIEKDVYEIVYQPQYKDIVKSVVTSVGVGLSFEISSTGATPYKSLVTVSFVDFKDREGINTSEIMQELSMKLLNGYPGVDLSIHKDDMGPPAGEDISLEISGPDYDKLIFWSDSIRQYLDMQRIEGIEGLKMDLQLGRPEAIVHVDRDKARRFGLNTMTIASTIRDALFGKKLGEYKEGEDEYDIMARFSEHYRNDLETLVEQKITFHENGRNVQLPISSVADVEFSSTYNVVRRKDMDRVITLYSNVIEGYNGTQINQQLTALMEGFEGLPDDYKYEFTGEQKEQQESMAFLGRAFMISLALILLILVSQFNSIIKPGIILLSVLFSTIGVFGGLATFNMPFVVVMTGIGIVSLGGIVVNNAIVLIDYIELLKKEKREELGLEPKAYLPVREATDCIVRAGQTRLRPVLLTAITTVLGLISLAVGFNIDFGGMINEFKPDIFFGGDMVIFWGPISWTVIFGLSFSTFLTLVIVPVIYRLTILAQKKMINLVASFSGKVDKVK